MQRPGFFRASHEPHWQGLRSLHAGKARATWRQCGKTEKLLVRVHIDHLTRGIRKRLEVELRDDEVFLFRSKAQLGSNDRVEHHRKLAGVVDSLQQHLVRRIKSYQLVGDVELRSRGCGGESVRDQHRSSRIAGSKRVNTGSGVHAVLTCSRAGGHTRERQSGIYAGRIAHAPVLFEIRSIGDGDLEGRGWDRSGLIQSGLNHAGTERLAKEKVVHHLAVDGGKLGFTAYLA